MTQTSPIAFAGCAGHLTLPRSGGQDRTGIVICRSWGFDELCTRKFLRCLADALAAAGFPVLRFDYPGTVDSLDLPDGEDLRSWTDAAMAACDSLKDAADCRQVVVFGLGPGALIAERVAHRRSDVAGLVLAAPIAGGKRFLRETGLRAKVILEGLGLAATALPEADVSIGGLVLARGVAADLQSTGIDMTPWAASLPCLVAARPTVPSDSETAARLGAAGHQVTVLPFDGYDKLMEDPTASIVPQALIAEMAEWCSATFPHEDCAEATARVPAAPARLVGDGFTEEGVVFRPEAPLFGVLCRPASPSPAGKGDKVAVFLNSGYDHHGGWARCWVDTARDLARRGIPSLRFDVSNIGDSPARPGDPDQVLYTQGPIRDVSDALDYLDATCPGAYVLIGRCSGAYGAFHAGHRDARVKALALINQLRLIWDPQESLVEVARMGPRSVGEYKRRLTDPRTFRRLFSGEISIRGVLRGLSIHVVSRLSHALAPVFPNLSKYGRFRAECHAIFRDLDRRRVAMAFLCSEGDESLEQLALYFGKDHAGLRAFGHVRLDTLPDADHNITPLPAQRQMRQWICEFVAGGGEPDCAHARIAPEQSLNL